MKYDYKCNRCGKIKEIEIRLEDLEARKKIPKCHGEEMQRVFWSMPFINNKIQGGK